MHPACPLLSAPQAWSLVSLFVAVICGFILSPLPSGAWALLGASVGLLTHTLEFNQMFAAANNTVVWLVVISFFLAKVCVGTQGRKQA
jgi:di/tricarboxylate transporter